MSARKGFLSSEDELVAGSIQEPVRYEFQPFLSNDDEDMPDVIPEPLVPDETSELSPRPILSDMAQPPIEDHDTPLLDDGYAPLDDGHVNGSANGATGSVSSVAGSFKGRVTGSASDNHGSDVKIVDIEVGLTWLSPIQRAAFKYVEVDEDELAQGFDKYSPRRLRKRQKVSTILIEPLLLVPSYPVCLFRLILGVKMQDGHIYRSQFTNRMTEIGHDSRHIRPFFHISDAVQSTSFLPSKRVLQLITHLSLLRLPHTQLSFFHSFMQRNTTQHLLSTSFECSTFLSSHFFALAQSK